MATQTEQAISQAIETLLSKGYQIARPERKESDKSTYPLGWFYVATKDGSNALYIGYDNDGWGVTKPYYPSKDNGSGARLNGSFEFVFPLEKIEEWLKTIVTVEALSQVNVYKFNLKTLRLYKDYDELKREHLDKASHVKYIYLTPENNKEIA